MAEPLRVVLRPGSTFVDTESCQLPWDERQEDLHLADDTPVKKKNRRNRT